jgi:hypothetical protein
MYEKERWDIPQDVAGILTSLSEMEGTFSEEPRTCRSGEAIVRRIFNDGRFYGGQAINVIPSSVSGMCERILIVAIGSSPYEDVQKRILQAIEHIHVKCSGITKYVIFWAAQFNSTAWMKHAGSFKNTTVILKLFGVNPTRLR